MSDSSADRVPRAGLDPITDAESALAVIRLAVDEPARPKTIVVTLDERRCGVHLAVITRTTSDDDVVDITERLLEGAEPTDEIEAIIVASVRPGCTGPCEHDLVRWSRIDGVAGDFGVELVEWFLIGDTVTYPRELAGVPSRWRP